MPLNQPLRKNSNVLWTISIIQDQNPEAQTKSEFSEMTSDVLNTDTIKNVTLCLADNLQRFRFMIQDGMSESDAISECQKLSAQWHQDNSEPIQKLKDSKNLSFITWEEFLEWPDRNNTLLELEKWYKENKDFRNSVDVRVKQVRENLKSDSKISNPVQQTELLKKYLLEECVFQKFAASKGFDYEIYKTAPCQSIRRVKNNTDFVPGGFMKEIYFTQFNQSVKNNVSINQPSIRVEKESFSPVFSKKPSAYSGGIDSSIPIKFAEFIEKTLKMVPPQEQEKAVEALMRFTTQEILPMCYSKNPSLKI